MALPLQKRTNIFCKKVFLLFQDETEGNLAEGQNPVRATLKQKTPLVITGGAFLFIAFDAFASGWPYAPQSGDFAKQNGIEVYPNELCSDSLGCKALSGIPVPLQRAAFTNKGIKGCLKPRAI